MNLDRLRTFVVVAKEASITRSAKKLFASPASVSAQIKALEEEWHVTLFHRTSRGLEITPAGQGLCKKAQEVLAVAQGLREHATRLSGTLLGSLRVGLYASENFPEIAELVKNFRCCHPSMELELIERISAEVLKEIADGSLDAGFFLGQPPNSSISSHALRNVPLAVVAPKAWQSRVVGATWETLSRFPWIDCPGYCPFQAAIEEIFRSKSLSYERMVHADGGLTRLKLVAADLGLALVTKSAAEAAIARERVIIVPTEPIPCEFSFGYLSSRTDDPLIAALRSAVLGGISSQKRQATTRASVRR